MQWTSPGWVQAVRPHPHAYPYEHAPTSLPGCLQTSWPSAEAHSGSDKHLPTSLTHVFPFALTSDRPGVGGGLTHV